MNLSPPFASQLRLMANCMHFFREVGACGRETRFHLIYLCWSCKCCKVSSADTSSLLISSFIGGVSNPGRWCSCLLMSSCYSLMEMLLPLESSRSAWGNLLWYMVCELIPRRVIALCPVGMRPWERLCSLLRHSVEVISPWGTWDSPYYRRS